MKTLTDDDIIVTKTPSPLLPKGAASMQRLVRRRTEHIDIPIRETEARDRVYAFEEHDRAAE